MPVYQYECTKCNHKFELTQSFNAEPSAQCPECNNGAKRLFIPVPVIFKGSGFYITDHRKDGNGDINKTSEVKPEAKAVEAKDNTVKDEVKEAEKL